MTAVSSEPTAVMSRAAVLIQLRRYDEASALLGPLVASEPGNAGPLCLLAQCQLGLGHAEGALGFAESAIAADPAAEWGHRLQAMASMKLGKVRVARTAASEAVRLAPNEPKARIVLSQVELAGGHLNAAMAAARRAVELSPQNTDCHLAVGNVLLRRRRPKEAEESFRAVLAIDPEHAPALNNLGVCLQRQGRMPESVHLFAEASKLDPRMRRPRQNAIASTRARPVGTAALVVVAIACWTGDSRALVCVPIIALGVIWFPQIPNRHGGQTHEYPRATRQQMRQLWREKSESQRVRTVFAFPVAMTANLVALLSAIGGVTGLVTGNFVGALVGLVIASPLAYGAWRIMRWRRATRFGRPD